MDFSLKSYIVALQLEVHGDDHVHELTLQPKVAERSLQSSHSTEPAESHIMSQTHYITVHIWKQMNYRNSRTNGPKLAESNLYVYLNRSNI